MATPRERILAGDPIEWVVITFDGRETYIEREAWAAAMGPPEGKSQEQLEAEFTAYCVSLARRSEPGT